MQLKIFNTYLIQREIISLVFNIGILIINIEELTGSIFYENQISTLIISVINLLFLLACVLYFRKDQKINLIRNLMHANIKFSENETEHSMFILI